MEAAVNVDMNAKLIEAVAVRYTRLRLGDDEATAAYALGSTLARCCRWAPLARLAEL